MDEEVLMQDDLATEGLEKYSKDKSCVFVRPSEDSDLELTLQKLGLGDEDPETFGYLARIFPDEEEAKEHFESLEFSPLDIYSCLYINGELKGEH